MRSMDSSQEATRTLTSSFTATLVAMGRALRHMHPALYALLIVLALVANLASVLIVVAK